MNNIKKKKEKRTIYSNSIQMQTIDHLIKFSFKIECHQDVRNEHMHESIQVKSFIKF
jgi:hypothetical protein